MSNLQNETAFIFVDPSQSNRLSLQTDITEDNGNDSLYNQTKIRNVVPISIISITLNIIIAYIELSNNIKIASSKYNSFDTLYVTKYVFYTTLTNSFYFMVTLCTSKKFKFLSKIFYLINSKLSQIS